MFGNYRNIYGDLASLIIFLLLIYYSWTICMAGSRWNYLLQRADKLVRENKFAGISNNYRKFLCLITLDKAEQLCSLTGKEVFDIEYISGVLNSAYDIPPHISEIFIKSMINRGIFIPVDNKKNYSIAPAYRHKKIIELIDSLDKAGKDKEAIEEAPNAHIHKNARLLLQFINDENSMNADAWDTRLENFFNADIDTESEEEIKPYEEGLLDKISNIFK